MADDSNQRVTLALLQQGQQHIIEILEDIRRVLEDHAKRIATLETKAAVNQMEWKDHRHTHKRERGMFGFAMAIGSAISAAIGSIWPKP